METVALVTTVLLLEYFGFVVLVGRARHLTGIQAPAVGGAPALDRAYRVQMNTLEQLLLVIPSMWIFALYLSPAWAAGLGAVFALGRLIYCVAYLADPARRGLGFLVGMLATMALLLGSLFATARAVLL